MKRADLLDRLIALETSGPATLQFDEGDPHVIAYRNQSSELEALVDEQETGIPRLDRMSLTERVTYWADKVSEAELLIETGGRGRFDDINEILMDRVTLRIYRNLSLEIAQECIDDYRSNLAAARLGIEKGEAS